MGLKMCFKITTFRKSLSTFVTMIRFLTCVPPHMNFESTRSHESLFTELAFERPFSRMSPHMISKMALSGECFRTTIHRTLKWFFTGVDPQMSFQVSLFSEGLIATLHWTHKWLFTCLLNILLKYINSFT